jgi:3',5'-cyclic AMP phosphodiesterase CpdA
MITAVPPGITGAGADPHHLGDVADAPGDSLIVLLAGDNRPGYRMQSQRIGYPQLSAFSPGAPGTWLPALGALPLAIVQTVVPTLDGFQDLATGLITHRPNGGGEAQVRDAMTRRLPADLVVNTGDLVFDGRRARLWRDFERKFGTPDGSPGSLRAGAPFLSAPGNHERIHTAEGRANWIAVMGAPPRPERFWFAADAGGDLARFVFLDSNVLANVHGVYDEAQAAALAQEQLEWLDRVLDTGARHRFVVLHHPPVMVGNHGGDWLPEASALRRDRVLEICARRGVTAVIGGHEHLYHRVYARGPADGFWIVTTGGAGGPLHRIDHEVREREYARALPAGLALDPATSRIESRHHFMRLVIPSAEGRAPYLEVYEVDRRGQEAPIERITLAPPP